MTTSKTAVVTGAFSYTGKYVTRLLLAREYEVRTLTSHTNRKSDFDTQVKVFPYDFDHPERLAEALGGIVTLVNTYWVRFPKGKTTFGAAVRNTKVLLAAAKAAGVRRIVHVSIANPSLNSPLAYYRGKAQLEQAITESGLSYAIVRPTVIFGAEDILINNIAWFVRRLPVFGIPGDGRYRVRPIYVEDMASLLVRAAESARNEIIDAVGPETFTFEELVRKIAGALGRPSRLMHLPAPLAYATTHAMGWLVGDVILTWQEYQGLMTGLLAPDGPATGQTRLSDWLMQNGDTLGRNYSSEIARHYK